MKELFRTLLMILLFMLFSSNLFAESTIVQFSNPSKPGLIKAISGNGNVTITGYDGSDVVVEIDTKEEIVTDPSENEKTKGLKRISGSSVNITHNKDENAIEISRSMKHVADMYIKVPFNTSFKTGNNVNDESFAIGNIQKLVYQSVLSGVAGGVLTGNIEISNISGDIEISTMNGDITLTDISGTVVANTMNGNIEVIFKNYTKGKPMSFSAMNGDVDVTLPSALKADIKVKNIDGEVFTDFEFEMIAVSTDEQSSGADGIFGANLGTMLGNNIYGKINGGGPEIRVTTIEGDIYVRKSN